MFNRSLQAAVSKSKPKTLTAAPGAIAKALQPNSSRTLGPAKIKDSVSDTTLIEGGNWPKLHSSGEHTVWTKRPARIAPVWRYNSSVSWIFFIVREKWNPRDTESLTATNRFPLRAHSQATPLQTQRHQQIWTERGLNWLYIDGSHQEAGQEPHSGCTHPQAVAFISNRAFPVSARKRMIAYAQNAIAAMGHDTPTSDGQWWCSLNSTPIMEQKSGQYMKSCNMFSSKRTLALMWSPGRGWHFKQLSLVPNDWDTLCIPSLPLSKLPSRA